MPKSESSTGMESEKRFEAMLSQYQGLLYRLCNRYCSREATVEDLMQDMSIALWRQREKLWQVPTGVQRTAWVWRVARNAAIDTVRKNPELQALDDSMTADMREEDHTLINSLYEEIDHFGEPDRTLLRMQLAGYSYEEIAKEIGMTEKNVSVRLVRLKEKLRITMSKI